MTARVRARSQLKLEGDDLVARLGRHLTGAIVDGRPRSGEQPNEVALARGFGVSRGPLRRAARLLESRGLVVARARHGFYVRTFDAADLDDLYDLRICHRELCALAGNPRLLRVLDDLAVEIRLVIVLIGRPYADPVTIAATHAPILDALAARDPDAAAAAIELHLGDARTRVVGQFPGAGRRCGGASGPIRRAAGRVTGASRPTTSRRGRFTESRPPSKPLSMLGPSKGVASFHTYLNDLHDVLCDRRSHTRFDAYCTRLNLSLDRKSIEPTVAALEPDKVAAAHQILQHFVADAP